MSIKEPVKSPIELFKNADLDYTNLVIELGDITNFKLYDFKMTPKKYLNFAKQDLKDNSDRGLINSRSNAKRSIDCLIDATLMGLNINIKDNIPKKAIEFSNTILVGEDKNIQPTQLKLFCALGFAPAFLISEVRLLRNKIEHDYELPKIEDVRKAIDVADLLIETVGFKGLNSYTMLISDIKNKEKEKEKGVMLNIDDGYSNDGITRFSLWGNGISSTDSYYNVNCNELIYYYLLRAMITSGYDEDDLKESIKLLINDIIKQPIEYINIKEVTH